MRLFGHKKSRGTKKARGISKGRATRKRILAHALRVSASFGLAGLTIGRLARDLGMSKSGLFAHFRSKRQLELATINQARMVFTSQVLAPATGGNQGIEHLWVLCDSWLAHIEHHRSSGVGGRKGVEIDFELIARLLSWHRRLRRHGLFP